MRAPDDHHDPSSETWAETIARSPSFQSEAEKLLIGVCLLRPQLIAAAAEEVFPENFLDPVLGRIWGLMVAGNAVSGKDIKITELIGSEALRLRFADGYTLGQVVTGLMCGDEIRETAWVEDAEHRVRELAVDIRGAADFEGSEDPATDTIDDPGPDWSVPKAPPEIPKLILLNPTLWEGHVVPERPWLLPGRIPAGKVCLLNGDGAAGKTTITLQLCAATVRGTDWLDALIDRPGPAIFFSAEEDSTEIHRRLAAIVDHHGISYSDLAGLGLHCIPGQDAVLGKPDTRYHSADALVPAARAGGM
jgi:hypothetical protein